MYILPDVRRAKSRLKIICKGIKQNLVRANTMRPGVRKKRRKRASPRISGGTKGEDADVTMRFIEDTTSTDSDSDIEHFSQKGKSKGQSGKKQEKQVLCVLLTISLILIVLMGMLLAVQHWWFTRQQDCLSPECVQLSGSLLHMMDTTEEPCEDFYQYACGYIDKDPLVPPDKPKYGSFSKLDIRNQGVIKQLLEKPGNSYSGGNSSAIEKVKLVYKVCMNISEKEGNIPRLYEVIRALGSWPISSASGTWDPLTWDLETLLYKAHLYGVSPLFSMGISQDDKNSSLNRIVVDQSGLTFSNYKDYIGNNTAKYKAAFVEYVSGVVMLLGADNFTAIQQATDIWDFEAKLAEVMDKPEERQDARTLYNLMTVEQLQEIFTNSINVSEYFAGIFPDPVKSSEHVVVYAPKYIRKMGDIVKETSKETLANYIVWHVVAEFLSYMPQSFELIEMKLRMFLIGTSASSPLWERCTSAASSSLGFAVGAMFIDETFNPEDKEIIEEILRRIRETFEARLPELDWMDDATKARAVDKARAVTQMIGYPDYIRDPEKLDENYSKLTITNSSFQNALNLVDFAVKKNIDNRYKPPDFTKWEMIPSEVNAYYTPVRNQIVFPAGILGTPFYEPAYPMALSYGAIGMVMGHELTHGFDSMGRLYDKFGNLENWWGNESTVNFEKKTQCLVEQYENYKVGDDHLNGITTLGENIADNGGLRTSFSAYQQWLDENSGFLDSSINLPGLNMTNEQLFFLGFAQMWCTRYTPEYAKQSLTTDSHSFARYRVIGTLSNMPEFSKAFKCSDKSPMNPEKKCAVW